MSAAPGADKMSATLRADALPATPDNAGQPPGLIPVATPSKGEGVKCVDYAVWQYTSESSTVIRRFDIFV